MRKSMLLSSNLNDMSGEENETIGVQQNLDLSGTLLQITTRYSNEYKYDVEVVKRTDGNGIQDYELVGGYAVDVFLYLQSLLNFTYKIRAEVNPTDFGRESVENGSIDLYLASYSLLPARTKYLDATFAVGQSRIFAFLDHQFEDNSSNQNIFITPFTLNLWICTIVVWTICLASFLVLNHYEKESSFCDMIFHCVTVTLQRGTHLTFFHNSTRIATIVFSFTIVILMASYSGIMTSISAVNRYTVDSIETLVNSHYKILLEFGYSSNSSSIKFMLEALTLLPIAMELLKKSEISKFTFISFEEAIMQVKNSPSTYIIDEETGVDAITEKLGGIPCTWGKISVFNLRYPWVLYMRKNATFKHIINTGIRERGILRRIRKKWIPQQQSDAVCFTGSGVSFKSIRIPQVRGAFELLAWTMLLACPIIFLIEKLHNMKNASAKRLRRILLS